MLYFICVRADGRKEIFSTPYLAALGGRFTDIEGPFASYEDAYQALKGPEFYTDGEGFEVWNG